MDVLAAAITRARPGDASAVRDLTRAAYSKWVPVIGREPKPMTADYDLAVRDHLIDLMHHGRALAALIETIPRGDHLLVENVAVAPHFQRMGLGRRLLTHAEHLAASLGHPQIRLYTNKRFVENVQFYLRLGYGIDREEPFRGGMTVYMSKLLPGKRSS